jgi:DNA-binding NarL/FixJ family response regulator
VSSLSKIKVLVVDDHPVVRAGLSAMVGYQDDMELVGEAANAAEAIKLFETITPDVTLVDLSLPDLSGIELITILRARSSRGRFLVLTANAGGSEIGRALRAGAHAYLFKGAPPDELLGAIRTVSRGGQYLSPSAGFKVAELAAHTDLTVRELETLKWIAFGHSNQQIAHEIGVTEDTIKFHVKNLLSKLGVASRSKAVAFGLRTGLLQSSHL